MELSIEGVDSCDVSSANQATCFCLCQSCSLVKCLQSCSYTAPLFAENYSEPIQPTPLGQFGIPSEIAVGPSTASLCALFFRIVLRQVNSTCGSLCFTTCYSANAKEGLRQTATVCSHMNYTTFNTCRASSVTSLLILF